MPSLELTLFGGFRARFESGDELVPRSKKAALLLARLALRAGEVHTRETLIGLLWSDRAEAQARASLRQELTVLRKMMGTSQPVLAIDGERLSLDATAVEVDVRAFEALAKSETARDLERAASLYRGPLLEGFAIRDAACEEWLTLERQRLRDLFLAVLDRLLARQMQEDAIHRAIATAQTLLTHDPLREDAHRTLMLLHARQGRRSLALKQYQLFSELLRSELGVDPEPETVQLHADILAGRTATTRLPATPATPVGNDARSAQAGAQPEAAALPVGDGGAADAYQFYQMGRSFFLRNVWGKGALEAARQLFEQAIEIDPNYARAYAGLADCDCYRLLLGVANASLDAIAANTARALQLDPELAEAHAAKGLMLYTAGNHVEANTAFEHAVRLGPDLFEAHYFYARNCRAQGLHEKAAELFERSAAINQNDFRALGLLVDEYRALGRPEDSLGAARRCVARINVEVAAQPDDGYTLAFGSNILAELGERALAGQWAARANRIDPDDAIVNYNLACTYAALGQSDAALDRLQATFAAVPINRRVFLEWMQHDTAIDPLRGHPSFVALVAKLEADVPAPVPARTDTVAISNIGDRRPAIAVLPFVNLSGDVEQDHVADGIVEEVTAALSRVRSFFVIARSSTLRYRDRPIDAPRVGSELGVRYLLQGSVRTSGDRIRIIVQLVEAASGTSIWADRYEGTRDELFDLEDRITERTVGAIEPTIRSAEIERARRKRPDNLEAYDYVMRALPHVLAVTPEASAEALRLTTEAVRLDPCYARANALAAWCHGWQVGNGWSASPESSRAEGMRLARTALELDADDPGVLTMVGATEMLVGDLGAAADHIGKALALDPNSAWAWIRSGYLHVYLGQPDTALEHFDRAARLSPFDPLNFNRYIGIALAHFVAERYRDAVTWAAKARLERPDLPWALRVLAATHAQLEEHDHAQAAARTLLSQCPRLTLPEIMATLPFRQSDARDRFAEGLLEAGIVDVGEQPRAGTASDKGPAVAVLPFANLSGDPDQQYFSDGITEDIITELSRWRQLKVMSRNSSFRYRDSAIDVKQVRRDLGVDYVVEGSIRRMGDRIRVTAQLIDAESGSHVWAERYDRDLEELFAVQGEVVQTIVGTLVGRVQAAGAERAKRKPPSNLAAYDCVLRGLALPWGDPEADAEARRLYERAIELDPDYGLAHALLALMIYAEWGTDPSCPDAALDRAFELAKRAVELDENESTCQIALGFIHLMRRSFDLAEQYHRRAVEMNPSNPQHLADMGSLLVYLGRPDEGLEWLNQARRVDPYFGPSWYWHHVGVAQMTARRYDEAIRAFSRSTTMPYWVRAYIAACHAQSGRTAQAKEWAAQALRARPDFSATWNATKEPFKHERDSDHLIAALRKAGIPGTAPPSVATVYDRRSVAVLPFENLGGNPAEEYFSDGITGDIITELSRFHELIVVAWYSSFQYRDGAADVNRVGRELQVAYVVEGSIRRVGDRIRITAQLIETTTGRHLWAEHYDRALDGLFDLQGEVARMIASALAVRIEAEDLARTKRKPRESMSAYDYWLRGKKRLDLWTPEANVEARRLFAKAIESDPEYPRGYAGLAFTHEWAAYYTAWDSEGTSSHDSARRYAERAVALDDTDHLPHVILGWVLHQRGEFEQAQRQFAHAAAMNPNDADTIMHRAMVLALEGRSDEGIERAEFAIRLNPRHPDWYLAFLGGCFFRARRYADAAAAWDRAPDSIPEVRACLAAACVLTGRPHDARRHMQEFLRRFSLHWTGQPGVRTFIATEFSFEASNDLSRFADALREAGMPE